ncbi:hypothetical protein [Alkalimarinus sediminis]|uniref:Uncharacterized protein n=1 Tax=Alkalimarinus sediminis TaxID=1632866 RepID=A0A9E8HHS4_9ALTE|nr:hypothetical protein [Alkalimarinus sediminis]UZW74664.1 hypothetical protein NNL22_16835 [Alkalimarinus sediminis]
MKTLTRNWVAIAAILLLPAVATSESLAERKSDTPVETWNHQEMELERAILTETIEPTAAGHSTNDMSTGEGHDGMKSTGDMTHETKKYSRASDYKRAIFGSN